ncbi:hypothetical protein [Delftia sp. PS-11]|uniref:hypothetical protein n=1 Tax=Delftia sp. PS-11 TaxID=2767222 RepID=UPI00245385C3|nr:hypothetical protein [Delftia sp. PS-11]KAJ8744602.1 hypothetical protein H9T68_11675 [Delftia sp. PS-11]
MIKISQLKARDLADMHLKDIEGEPMFYKPDPESKDEKPVLIRVYGPGSEPYRKAQVAAQRRVAVLLKKNRRALEDRTPDERAADTAVLLADITHSVEGLELDADGREGVVALYADPQCGWVAEQVNSFAADWANFSASAPKA